MIKFSPKRAMVAKNEVIPYLILSDVVFVFIFVRCKESYSMHMSHFAYACKTEGKNGICHLISGLCVNCLISIPEYSRLNHLDVHLV